METTEKATHESIHLWAPVIKGNDGKYIAVLSDDSVDRDDEIVSKAALQQVMAHDGYTAILLNHKNDVLLQIGEWTNKRLEVINGHTAYVAEPKFYLSNPNAQIIKGCLDEGAQYGISIGAIVKNSEYVDKGGKKYKSFTELELLEASFVAIPSNRHGMAMAVAKMYNEAHTEEKKMTEETIVEKTFTQKDIDEVTTKAKTDFETLEASKVELQKQFDAAVMEKTVLETKIKELEELKVLKGNMETVELSDNKNHAQVEKECESGALPVVTK